MNEQLEWALWWTYAWTSAHTSWLPPGLVIDPARLLDQPMQAGKAYAVEPCLPPPPNVPLLRFLCAAPVQRTLIMGLINDICDSQQHSELNDEHRTWCNSLAKALRLERWLEFPPSPLQLLRAWTRPDEWQRLRLAFEYADITTLEQAAPLHIPHQQLEVLWSASIARVTPTLEDRIAGSSLRRETSCSVDER